MFTSSANSTSCDIEDDYSLRNATSISASVGESLKPTIDFLINRVMELDNSNKKLQHTVDQLIEQSKNAQQHQLHTNNILTEILSMCRGNALSSVSSTMQTSSKRNRLDEIDVEISGTIDYHNNSRDDDIIMKTPPTISNANNPTIGAWNTEIVDIDTSSHSMSSSSNSAPPFFTLSKYGDPFVITGMTMPISEALDGLLKQKLQYNLAPKDSASKHNKFRSDFKIAFQYLIKYFGNEETKKFLCMVRPRCGDPERLEWSTLNGSIHASIMAMINADLASERTNLKTYTLSTIVNVLRDRQKPT